MTRRSAMVDLAPMHGGRDPGRVATLPDTWLARFGLLLVALMTLGIVVAAFVRC